MASFPIITNLSGLRNAALLFGVIVCAAWPVAAPRTDQRILWNQPFEPFRLVDNVYYVGVAGISSFLIVTAEGSFLWDGGLRESAPLIARNITKLGFRLQDVKYLLNSHVHYDHAGGLAELKDRTGATMVASAYVAKSLQLGGPEVPPLKVDRLVGHGDSVQLGDTTMTALLTPGHTEGCTTWTSTKHESATPLRVLFLCGLSVVQPLVGNARYPNVVEDYNRTFGMLRSVSADVFLEGHPERWDMIGKLKRRRAGEPNPFVDPTELPRFVARSEQEFRAELRRQQLPQ